MLFECAHNYMFVTRSCYLLVWVGVSALNHSFRSTVVVTATVITKCGMHKKENTFLIRKRKGAHLNGFLLFLFLVLLPCIKHCLLYRGLSIASLWLFLYLSFGLLCVSMFFFFASLISCSIKSHAKIVCLVKNNYSKLVICLLSISRYVFKLWFW